MAVQQNSGVGEYTPGETSNAVGLAFVALLTDTVALD